jgi:histidinol-phosphate/aromatic aminotransferase/cobyric acid decarboxylase-like protein/choline kinase
MQALILAAGMGKRLKDLTADDTKCMVKVNGVRLIERVLQQLDNINLNKIVLVVGYKAESLLAFIDTLEISTPIEIVENPIYDSTNNIYSLFLARSFLLEDDTLLLESDLIFEDNVLNCLVDDPYPSLALVAKYESWMNGTVVTLDSENNIIDFLGKKHFKFNDISTYYKTVNIYKFSKEFSASHYVPFLEAYCKALGHNEYYEQVLRVISLLDNPNIKAKVLKNEIWYEIDDKQDLDIAESLFTEDVNEKYKKLASRYGGYWRYPKLLDYCYLVNPYYPPQRLIEEINANTDRLIRDYPSGQQVNALLAAKYFEVDKEMVVVGNGAAELIKALLDKLAGNVGLIRPTFEEYPNRLPSDRIVSFVPQNKELSYDDKDLIQHFTNKNIKALVLINPDNPTGNLLNKKQVENVASWSKENNILFIVDESFIDFAEEGTYNSILEKDYLIKNPHIIVIKSISKSYGVPGLRLGIAFSGDLNLINNMKKEIAIWNINSFAEFYLQIWEHYRSDYNNAIRQFKLARKEFLKDLEKISFIKTFPSEANYFICKVKEPYTSALIANKLLEKNILIKDLTDKNGLVGEYIRIAIKKREENKALIEALKSI